jgi:hypothetical protein
MPHLSVWKYLVTDRLIYRNIPPVNLRLAQFIRTVPPCSTYLDLINSTRPGTRMFSCRRGDSEPKGHCVWRSGPDYEWLNSQLYGVRLNRLREYFLSHEERLDGKRMYKILWYHLVSMNIIGNVHKRTSRFQDRRPSITAAVLGRWWRSSKSEKAGAEQEEDDGSQDGRRAESKSNPASD